MNRIEVKRGTTIINVPETEFEWYEQRGYKKAAATPRARKTTTKTTAKAETEK